MLNPEQNNFEDNGKKRTSGSSIVTAKTQFVFVLFS